MSAWHVSHRFDSDVVPLADRHYNRQTPGSPQFSPPGKLLVLKTAALDAYWVTCWPRYAKHQWAGAWMNAAFRNEGPLLSSDLIRDAVACTRAKFRSIPELGMITFVDPTKVRHKRDPGRCYLRAGFRRAGFIMGGLIALQMLPDDMPPEHYPDGAPLFAAADRLAGEGVR